MINTFDFMIEIEAWEASITVLIFQVLNNSIDKKKKEGREMVGTLSLDPGML